MKVAITATFSPSKIMKASFFHQTISSYKILSVISLFFLSLGLNSCSVFSQANAGNSESIEPELEAKIIQVIRNNPEVIFKSVARYRQKKYKEEQYAQKAFLENMQTNPNSVIGESPITGASQKKLLLIEFSDFQCLSCAKAHQTIKEFMVKHQDKVTLVHKNLPLSEIHPQALPAAKASWAAGKQGKFWEFRSALFENQQQLGDEFYVKTAKSLNLDINQFNRDRKSNTANLAMQKDIRLAEELGFDATPILAINGQLVSGAIQLSELEALLAQTSE